MQARGLILSLTVVFMGASSAEQYLIANSGDKNEDEAKWKITLVSEDEPGIPMMVSGTVYGLDGETPLEGIEVHVYHTDARGYYSENSTSARNPRIQGTMITNAEGKYQYRTIKPASYPNSRVPSHVHYVVSGPGYKTQRFSLEFKGDPHISESEYLREAKKGKFAEIRPLEKDEDGVLRCEFNLKLQKKK